MLELGQLLNLLTKLFVFEDDLIILLPQDLVLLRFFFVFKFHTVRQVLRLDVRLESAFDFF